MTDDRYPLESLLALISDAVFLKASSIILSDIEGKTIITYGIEGHACRQQKFSADEMSRMKVALSVHLSPSEAISDNSQASNTLKIDLKDGRETLVRLARVPLYPAGYEILMKILVRNKS